MKQNLKAIAKAKRAFGKTGCVVRDGENLYAEDCKLCGKLVILKNNKNCPVLRQECN